MDILIDFNGTYVTHKFPKVGIGIIYADPTWMELLNRGGIKQNPADNLDFNKFLKFFNMKKFYLIFLISLLFSCRSIVNPNEWVVSTATCWNTMSVTKAGDVIPRLTLSCDRMIILPATFMAADFMVETKFENRVAGTVNLTYQWRISDPIKFIASAKSITSSPTSDDNKIDPNALEVIENSVVDKMIIDVIREYTPNKSAGLDELTIEKEVFNLCLNRFADRGVEFASMSVNVTFSPQIEEALDAMSAIKFYEANNEKDLGRDIIRAKAGSANIQTK